MEIPNHYGNSSMASKEYVNIWRKFLWLLKAIWLAIESSRTHTYLSGIQLEDAKIFFEKSYEAAMN